MKAIKLLNAVRADLKVFQNSIGIIVSHYASITTVVGH